MQVLWNKMHAILSVQPVRWTLWQQGEKNWRLPWKLLDLPAFLPPAHPSEWLMNTYITNEQFKAVLQKRRKSKVCPATQGSRAHSLACALRGSPSTYRTGPVQIFSHFTIFREMKIFFISGTKEKKGRPTRKRRRAEDKLRSRSPISK